jgi:hypothetical protein
LHHQLERRDALGGARRDRGVHHQPLGEVGFGPHRPHLWPLVEHDVLLVTPDRDVPGPVQHVRLGAEGAVDRLDRDASGAPDVGDRGAAVPLLEEEVTRCAHDQALGLGRLLSPAGGVVRPLDRTRQIRYTSNVFVQVQL